MDEQSKMKENNSAFYVPASILLAALVITGALFMVGGDISAKISGLSIVAGSQDNGGTNNNNGTNNGGSNNSSGNDTGTGFSGLSSEEIFDQLIELGPTVGNKDAEYNIVQFSDFSCPWCAVASGQDEELLAQVQASRGADFEAPMPLIEEYVKEGKVSYTMVYFPGHGTGDASHTVGWCVYDQDADMFMEYHNLAFENHENTGNLASMKELAIEAGADSDALDACISSGKYADKFQEGTDAGRAIGISGTPFFFINGTAVRDWSDLSQFSTIIEG